MHTPTRLSHSGLRTVLLDLSLITVSSSLGVVYDWIMKGPSIPRTLPHILPLHSISQLHRIALHFLNTFSFHALCGSYPALPCPFLLYSLHSVNASSSSSGSTSPRCSFLNSNFHSPKAISRLQFLTLLIKLPCSHHDCLRLTVHTPISHHR